MATKSDAEQIWDVLVNYCYLIDTRRPSEIPEAIFTEDAMDDHGHGIVQGREALRAMFEASMEVLDATVHALSNHALVIEGDTARSRCYCTAWHWSTATADQGPCRPADFVSTGAYSDEFRRVDGRWLISHRKCHLMGPQGLTIGAVTPELVQMMEKLSQNGFPPDILNP